MTNLIKCAIGIGLFGSLVVGTIISDGKTTNPLNKEKKQALKKLKKMLDSEEKFIKKQMKVA